MAMQSELSIDAQDEHSIPEFHGLVGRHPSMLRVFDVLRRVGPTRASVLIHGESGTGKELVARALHDLSPRRARPLVPVHCGAIPEELLESELFGHIRGAFTGAVAARAGRFALAHGGTIFLDEIGEMSPRFQVKLLRVLEDGSFDPVGSSSPQHADVRVVAASHRDLQAAARDGSFRDDLLYRLDVVSIHLPALRDRAEDVPLIARALLHDFRVRLGLPQRALSPDAASHLQKHSWPGNVRELRNLLERAVLLSDREGDLQPDDLPFDGVAPQRRVEPGERPGEEFPEAVVAGATPWEFGPEGADLYGELEAFEHRMISQALRLAKGSKREAARLLQVNRTTLLEKMKRRGWDTPGDRRPNARYEPLAGAAAPAPTLALGHA